MADRARTIHTREATDTYENRGDVGCLKDSRKTMTEGILVSLKQDKDVGSGYYRNSREAVEGEDLGLDRARRLVLGERLGEAITTGVSQLVYQGLETRPFNYNAAEHSATVAIAR